MWECEDGHTECISSIEELKERSGKLPERDGELDLHKPYIDEVTFPCGTCEKEMTRIPEVFGLLV